MPLGIRVLVAAVLVSAVALPLRAQEWGKMSPAERQALAGHRLTMDNITRAAAAGARLNELEKDPSVKAAMDREEATSLTDAIAKMDAVPQIHGIIQGSGLTAKQFMFTVIELASTRAAARLTAMGGSAAKAAASIPTSPQNLQFYAAHQAEIEPLAKQMMHSDDDSEE